ncbi:MAG: hypothetical protein GY745_22165 [Actinomycetia bacterium]|nr:hypothetical protein [Actinomycetes bacterium]
MKRFAHRPIVFELVVGLAVLGLGLLGLVSPAMASGWANAGSAYHYDTVVDVGPTVAVPGTEVMADRSANQAQPALRVFGPVSGLASSLFAPNGTLGTKIPTEGRKFNQLQTRGWDQSSIDELVNGPVHTSPAVNRASGNPATAYFDDAGGYVVRDDLTGDLVQMSDRFDPD